MKINCIIVDDEPLARKGLAEYVSEVDFLDLKALCSSSTEANKSLNQQKTDLVFLDIQMPGLNGIEFLKTMKTKPMVILTTAYSEFALEGYELDVLDYLVKPISFNRFLKACNKAKEYYEFVHNKNTGNSHFFIRCDNRFERIDHDKLLFVEAMENYVVLQTTTQKFISYLTLKSVENYLPQQSFIRVHKSFIVSLSKIERIDGNEVKIGIHSIPISRNLKDEVMNNVVNKNLLKR